MADAAHTRPTLLLRLRDKEDKQAWGEFVEIYAPMIHAYCMHRGLQDADAADVTQEVLQVVAATMHQFRYDPDRGSFRGWLFTATLNKLRDAANRRPRQAIGSGDTGQYEQLQQMPAEQAEADWNQHYRWQLFLWAAEKARVDFRPATWQAFWLTAVQQQPVRAVAEQLQMSSGAIHIARSRVLRRIKEVVASVTPEEI